MHACPRCRATYPDDVAQCPEDGSALLPGELLPPAEPVVEAGTMIGEYRIERKLGAGTFGEVYAGEQPLIGKRVAVKLLQRKLSTDAEAVSRFVSEARAVNRIRHRNIIDVFSFGRTDDGRHYFVMELLEGLTLRELLDREGPLSIERALPIFRGIAEGLDAAHDAGVTHRDLKPDNVYLAIERDGSFFPKLLDFGIAKLAGEDVAHRTATGMAVGTPRYMSPEQCRGKAVDRQADVYSLGVIVHEALTGKPPFEAETMIDLFMCHANEPPKPMSHVTTSVPPELDEPVLAMLAKKPKDRPQTAGQAIRSLEERARALSGAGPAAVDPAPKPVEPGVPTVKVRDRAPADDAELSSAKTVEASALGRAESVPVSLGDLDEPSVRVAAATASGSSGATLPSAGSGSGPAVSSGVAPASKLRGPGAWVAIGLGVVALGAVGASIFRPGAPPAVSTGDVTASAPGVGRDAPLESASVAITPQPFSSSERAADTASAQAVSNTAPLATVAPTTAALPSASPAGTSPATASPSPSVRGATKPATTTKAKVHEDLERPPELTPTGR